MRKSLKIACILVLFLGQSLDAADFKRQEATRRAWLWASFWGGAAGLLGGCIASCHTKSSEGQIISAFVGLAGFGLALKSGDDLGLFEWGAGNRLSIRNVRVKGSLTMQSTNSNGSQQILSSIVGKNVVIKQSHTGGSTLSEGFDENHSTMSGITISRIELNTPFPVFIQRAPTDTIDLGR